MHESGGQKKPLGMVEEALASRHSMHSYQKLDKSPSLIYLNKPMFKPQESLPVFTRGLFVVLSPPPPPPVSGPVDPPASRETCTQSTH